MESYFFYNHVSEEEKAAGVKEGILELAHLKEQIALENAEYYLCGPAVFIEKNYRDLISSGIKKEQIFYEEFGPSVLNLN